MSPIPTTFTMIATTTTETTDLMSLPYREPQQPVDCYDDDEESLCPSDEETTTVSSAEEENEDRVSDLNASVSSLALEDVFVPTPTPTETAVTTKTAGKKRGRNVRFAEDTVTESIHTVATETVPAQQQWWTRDELKTTQRSFVFAVKRQELGMRQAKDEEQQDAYDSLLLDGSSSRCRKRRKTVRSQVISTIAAVRDYEVVTQTETPSEMLSQLLERYTAPSVFEASQRAKALEKVTTVVAPKTVTAKKTSTSTSPVLPTVSELVKVSSAAMAKKTTNLYSLHSSCSSLFASARATNENNNFSLQNSSSALAA